jgi:hypothetical protein
MILRPRLADHERSLVQRLSAVAFTDLPLPVFP